jgi:hypothetical protein
MEICPKLKIKIPRMLFVQLSKWGDIKGDIDDQKDLKQALDSKADVSNLG